MVVVDLIYAVHAGKRPADTAALAGPSKHFG